MIVLCDPGHRLRSSKELASFPVKRIWNIRSQATGAIFSVVSFCCRERTHHDVMTDAMGANKALSRTTFRIKAVVVHVKHQVLSIRDRIIRTQPSILIASFVHTQIAELTSAGNRNVSEIRLAGNDYFDSLSTD